MGFGLPGLPPVPSLPNFGTGPIDDALAKDEKVRLSELLRRNGWGHKNSRLNREARGVIGCESRNDPDAYNDAPCGAGENAVGLAQVCTVHRGTKGIPRDKEAAVKWLKDPDNNLAAARKIHREAGGWSPWECPVTTTDADPEITVKKRGVTDAVADVADPFLAPLDEIAGFFGVLTQSDTWFRVGKVVLGASLLGMGSLAIILAAGKTVGKSRVGKAALSVTPTGRAATVAKGVVK
jgi:Transglycosylase SLT domain